jgi:hypothetical protein
MHYFNIYNFIFFDRPLLKNTVLYSCLSEFFIIVLNVMSILIG